MTFAERSMRNSPTPDRDAGSRTPFAFRKSVLAVSLAVLFMSACGERRTVAGPPAPAPAPKLPPSSNRTDAPLSAPQTVIALPPAQEIPQGAEPARRPPETTATAKPSVRDQRPRTPRPDPSPASAPAPPATPTEPAAASDLPQLSPLISPNQRRSMEGELDQRLAKTRADLSKLMGRSLNGEQVAAVKRIQAFLKQAEDTRAQDLSLARNLAQRAQVLAEDLVRSAQ